ncbi:glycosyltransferase family 4 protein [Paraburkholderia sp. BCC1884]|uniref:glycosyltransferase family 4 protein n=1 Tax=Paraburkholderia sp. BCC1884 TaxID=2562668 RepID=UPI001642437A|nr:glycosyltransferase family 4 protein [Paraburkholderia sp. BCC1884]
MKSVAVFHPGLQHAHQLARGLHEHGLLQTFWSGVPLSANGSRSMSIVPAQIRGKVRNTTIPTALRRHPVWWQILLRARSLARSAPMQHDYTHRVFHWFDWWVSRHVVALRPRAVVGYENSSYHTFMAARSVGAVCILDAPSLHHEDARRLIEVPSNGYIDEINRRKDKEVELADLVITCSDLARDSYLKAGVSASKVKSILLGAELPDGVARPSESERPVQFIFAGTLSSRKSIDLILDAFARLNVNGHRADLTLVGGTEEAQWLTRAKQIPHVSHCPNVPQAQLYQLFAQADCLLLPSRFDAFGMVVVEAMATGTPAIVSTMTGAREIISLFPDSGWVVEPTAEAIFRCMEDKVMNRQAIRTASPYALKAAGHFTWRAYRRRVADLIAETVE